MDILETVDSEEAGQLLKVSPCFRSFISEDMSILYLSYPRIDSDEYDDYFDRLNLYDKIKLLVLKTDYINKIPDSILKFTNLKLLDIQGSRFWDLNMTQVPVSVEVLYLTKHSNLQRGCIKGIDKLVNLRELHLDFEPFFFMDIFENNYDEDEYEDPIMPISNLLSLKSITFVSGIYYTDDLKSDWKEIFKQHKLFDNIRRRITNINLECDHDDFDIKMELN